MSSKSRTWLFSLVVLAVLVLGLATWSVVRDRVWPYVTEDQASEILSLEVSPDGAFAVAGHRDGNLSLWNPSNGSVVRIPGKNRKGLKTVAISYDGRFIAAGSSWYDQRGGTVSVYDRSAKQWIVQREDSGPSPALAFHPSQPLLAYATVDDSISVFDIRADRETKRLASRSLRLSDLAFSPDGRRLLLAGPESKVFPEGAIALWDIEEDRKVAEFIGHKRWAEEVEFSADGEWIGSICTGDALIVWNVKAVKLAHRFFHQSWLPSSLAFAPDGSTVFMGLGDGSITELSLREGKHNRAWTPMADSFNGHRAMYVRCDPQGRYVACARGRDVVFMTGPPNPHK